MTPTVQPHLSYQCPHCRATLEAPPHCGPDEVVTCPACQRTFQVALSGAKEEAGRAIVLPPGVEAPPPAPQVVPAAQPVAQPTAVPAAATAAQPAPAAVPVVAQPAETPEHAVDVVHLSTWRRYPGRCFLYVVFIVAAAAAVVWCLNEGFTVWAALPGAVLAYLAYHVITWGVRMRNTTLTITDRRIVIETGVFTRRLTEVGRKDVDDVLVAQDPIMRIFDVGDLVIRSHGGKEKEIVIMAVPNPTEVAQKITPPHAQAGATSAA
jgi:membrane protein YdbS with pleckstrin-like domain